MMNKNEQRVLSTAGEILLENLPPGVSRRYAIYWLYRRGLDEMFEEIVQNAMAKAPGAVLRQLDKRFSVIMHPRREFPVLAKDYKGKPSTVVYANRTQATKSAEKWGGVVIQGQHRGFLVMFPEKRSPQDLQEESPPERQQEPQHDSLTLPEPKAEPRVRADREKRWRPDGEPAPKPSVSTLDPNVKVRAKHRGHMLLTPKLRKSLPKLYATENTATEDKVIQVKFFNPYGSGSWLGVEASAILLDGTEVPINSRAAASALRNGELYDVTFFGYVEGLGGDEWGYFSLRELEELPGRIGGRTSYAIPSIERDLHFRPGPFAQVMKSEHPGSRSQEPETLPESLFAFYENVEPAPPGKFKMSVGAVPNPDFSPPSPEATVSIPPRWGTVRDSKDAATRWVRFIRVNNLGFGNTYPFGHVYDDEGRHVADVAYNGRVFAPGTTDDVTFGEAPAATPAPAASQPSSKFGKLLDLYEAAGVTSISLGQVMADAALTREETISRLRERDVILPRSADPGFALDLSAKPPPSTGAKVVDIATARGKRKAKPPRAPEKPQAEAAPDIIPVVTARLNKNNSWSEYVDQFEGGPQEFGLSDPKRPSWRTTRGKVVERRPMDREEYDKLIESLMDDRDWLAGKGGGGSTYDVPAEFADVESAHQLPEPHLQNWKDEAYADLIEVTAPRRRTIYLNPEGYNYARYVYWPEGTDATWHPWTSETRTPKPAPERKPAKTSYGRGFVGSKYEATKGLDIKEIAKRIRGDLKAKFPPRDGWKFSVTIERYSGGQSVNVDVKQVPHAFGVENPEWTQYQAAHPQEGIPHGMKRLTPAAEGVEQRIKEIVEAYNFDDSDSMTDYFNVRFYKHIRLPNDVKQAPPKSTPPTASGQATSRYSKAMMRAVLKRLGAVLWTKNSRRGIAIFERGETIELTYLGSPEPPWGMARADIGPWQEKQRAETRGYMKGIRDKLRSAGFTADMQRGSNDKETGTILVTPIGPARRSSGRGPLVKGTAQAGEEGCREVSFSLPGHGRVSVVCGAQGRRDVWHNVQVSGSRYGWNGKRWARHKSPAPAVLKAIREQGVTVFPER